MNEHLQIIQTIDGSNTIFNALIGENYHSRHGALQESQHVFVNAGLNYLLDGKDTDAVSIFEVGFGTGLNFLLSAGVCAARNIKLNYVGVEAYPLSNEMLNQTGYDEYVSPDLWKSFIDNYSQSLCSPVELNNYCQLQIPNCQLLNFQSAKQFDIIYFDAFAAVHQPEMWNETAIGHTIKFLKPGGIFVTYAITGNLKRMLKSMGLQIQKIPGAAGKREMLRAVINLRI